MRARVWRRAAILPAAALSLLTATPSASAEDPFLTSEPLMITLTDPTTSDALPIISVGDQIGDFDFEGIPDGIGAMPGAEGTVEAFVTHEQSTVPFQGLADFESASVSHLTLDVTGGVVDASVSLPPEAGFHRFCSATMAGPAEGLSSFLFLTGEEANEAVEVPAGATFGPDPAYAPDNLRQAGYAVILDPVTGDFTHVAGMGRHNHENAMVLPGGWDKIAVISGDDTFSAPSSQLYLYLADDEEAIWADEGRLLAFRVTHKNGVRVRPGDAFNEANDYGDITGEDRLSGRFIRVPAPIARGLTSLPPQEALERWSNRHNVFQFIRVEDTAYDPNVGPGENPVMYLADTGSSSAVPDPATGRLTSGTGGVFGNGRIFRMEFAKNDPRRVRELSIVLDGNAATNPLAPDPAMKNPDNLGISANSLMIQEDVSSGFESRILRYDLDAETLSVVGHVNTIGWESSGIVDASAFFGDGAWLLDVQAHSLLVDQEPAGDVTLKREGGQLILLRVPGS
ncbi:MAG: alkaline phosphatase PhoX [Actinomycetota bacterium]